MPTRTEVKFKIKEAFIKNLPLNKNVSIHDFDIPKLTESILTAIETDCHVIPYGEYYSIEDAKEEQERIENEKSK